MNHQMILLRIMGGVSQRVHYNISTLQAVQCPSELRQVELEYLICIYNYGH